MSLNTQNNTKPVAFVFDQCFASVSYGNGVRYNYWRREDDEQRLEAGVVLAFINYEKHADGPARIGLRKLAFLCGHDPDLKNRSSPLGSWKYHRWGLRQWREVSPARGQARIVKRGARKKSLSSSLVMKTRWAKECGLAIEYHDLAKRSWREREELLEEARELQTREEIWDLEQALALKKEKGERAELRQEIAWKKSSLLEKVRLSCYEKKKEQNEGDRKRREMLLLREHKHLRRWGTVAGS